MDETGTVLSEECTLLLAVQAVLRSTPGLVVTNVSTTGAVEEVAGRLGGTVRRTPVGDIHVSRCMRETGAVVGGEGNGGVIVPRVQYCRDGIAALALILSYLAREKQPLSSVAAGLPRRSMIKEKLETQLSTDEVRADLERIWPDGVWDCTDGVKVTTSRGWVHLRPSRTEPVVRLIVEADSETGARGLRRQALEAIGRPEQS
jgi:phosphomannomutase